MKIEGLLSRYEKLVQKAYDAADGDVFINSVRKARDLEKEIEDALLRMEAGYGEDFANGYIVRFERAQAALKKAE